MKSKSVLSLTLALFLISGLLLIFKEQLVNSFIPQPKFSELDNPKLVQTIKTQSGQWDTNFNQPIFLNAPVSLPVAVVADSNVLGVVQAQGEKWIEIDLSDQKLYAHEGDNIVYTFLVSTGKWGATPIGDFRIWVKLRYSTMSGGDKSIGTYYYLPNVPYVMFFHNAFALHGTYWHNNFGTPMSHGCVNLSTIDAGKLYYWTDPPVEPEKSVFHPTKEFPGTRVVVHE
ncbi:MAG: L,D-transpeptidase [Candidatus Gottesmanbacteria bacterium]